MKIQQGGVLVQVQRLLEQALQMQQWQQKQTIS
jgi:hypothetical protein